MSWSIERIEKKLDQLSESVDKLVTLVEILIHVATNQGATTLETDAALLVRLADKIHSERHA